ncbi:MAG: UDP-N-acetylmuramoyl-L-alanyl-D-glutamate--2,6-diaminopimelate ligase [Phycisphaeraceae bacterium]|jgi:UDP-N-acetylmuramoyl-L-alanyl-D-glutamate--2,6-diaminopimelate ligase|nr:UDP-N-acetylmuramoyl-L-alanyl-D-glutamate--2,6-diaminopimelate ligase [Phycisphaeraceae bacterium]
MSAALEVCAVDLAMLIEGVPVRSLAGPLSVRITDLTEDSRTAMPGSLFVARRGQKSDGHASIPAAIGAGAVAVLCQDAQTRLPAGAGGVALLHAENVGFAQAVLAERFFGSPSSKLCLCGVTGTNGKTTVASLVHQLLNNAQGGAAMRCGLIGTVCIDDGTEVAPAHLTTPPAMELSRTLARMVEAGCRACVMESSSHALDQHRVSGLRYQVGIYTNLSHDHLDYHKTMDAYASAKARLFSLLPDAGDGGVAVLNADDAYAQRMAQDCRARVVWCTQRSGNGPAQVRGTTISATPRTTTIDVAAPWTEQEPGGVARIVLRIVGEHNVMNALEAGTAAWAMGLPGAQVVAGLGAVGAPPGRLQPVAGAGVPFAVYVDYAHSDDSLARVGVTLRQSMQGGGGRLIIVFGCGGDRDRSKRPKMGRVAAELGDVVIVTSDNPRTEQPHAIIDEVLAGVPAGERARVLVQVDRRSAIVSAIAQARSGDVVLIAGKGHEDYQILPDPSRPGQTVRVHFDDREVALSALALAGYGGVAG